MNAVGVENSTDYEHSPAKMFVGLFVLIVLVASSFFVVSLVARRETRPQETDQDSFSSPLLNEGLNRSPDGSLQNDPLDQLEDAGLKNTPDIDTPGIDTPDIDTPDIDTPGIN